MNKKLLTIYAIVVGFILAISPSMMVMGQEPIYGGTLNTPLSADAHALNPFTWGTTYEAYVLGHIYDSLVLLDTERQPVESMCESYSHSTDYVTWTFVLRDDMYWHDGEPVTVWDVNYTYSELWADSDIPRRSWLFDEIASIDVVEAENKVIVEFGWGPKPADVLFDLATTWIVPEHIWSEVDWYEFANDVEPIGCGPFKFVEWARGQFFRLETHDDYHLDGPYVDEKVLPIISEVETAYFALSVGDIEVMANPPPELEAAAYAFNVSIHEALQDYWVYLGMNQRRYPNNVTEFRQAVLTGIDRQEIVDVIRYGRGEVCPASCSLPYGPYYNPNVREYDYNVTLANKMLDDLGFLDNVGSDGIREDLTGADLEFDLIVSADAQVSVDSCLFIQEYMADLGIKVNVEPMIWDLLWETVGGTGAETNTWDYDWAFLGWVGFWSDFHPSWARWLFSANGWWGSDDVNIPGWNSTIRWNVTELADDVLYSTDEAEVKLMLDEIQELVAEDLPYLPINILGGTYLYRTDEFDGWVLGPTTGPDNWMSWLSLQLVQAPKSGPGFLALSAILTLVVSAGLVRRKRKKQ